MSQENNPNESLLTATQVRTWYGFTDKMMAMLKPAFTYQRIGQKNPIRLFYQKDVEALLNSPVGQKLLAEAAVRRKRFWEAMQKRLQLIQDELELRKEIEDNNDDLQ